MIEYLPTIITFFFLLIVLSYYVLLFIKKRKPAIERRFSSISIIIPAHNEERYLKECIESALAAEFHGKKQLIVVDDGSIDSTAKVARSYKGIILVKAAHSGKSASINRGLEIASGELIAVVDADSCISKNALLETARIVGQKDFAACCCVIKVKNRKWHIGMWLHIEQIYNSLMRLLLSKINANITTPGPLSVYRKKELMEIGGFNEEGFSEDVDITIRLIRRGHRIGFAQKAVSETYMPVDAKGFFRQRARFARGLLNVLKRHLKMNSAMIDIYTLPLLLFSYVQAVVMGSFTAYQIISGYMTYFASKGVFLGLGVLKFFFEWLSIVGFIRWGTGIFYGTTALNFVNVIGILSTLLSYPLFLYAVLKFDKRLDIWHIIPLTFMFPFWLLVMAVYIASFPWIFGKQKNIWKKNE